MAQEAESTVLCFIGQGAAATGSFYEALNLIALHQLNVIVLTYRRNLSSSDSPLCPQVAGSLVSKAESFGIQSSSINGRDYETVKKAVAKARQAGGPHLIEALLD